MATVSVRRHVGRRRGVAAVEFAVVASLLFVLILGIIELGRAMMVLEVLNNAARNGARVGVLSGSTNDLVTKAVNDTLSGSTVSGHTTTILVNGSSGSVSSAASGDAITVAVNVPYSKVTWLPATLFMGGKSLSGRAVMRRE